MKQWQSTKWILFVSRPVDVLQRELRDQCYFGVSAMSPIHIGEVLTIGDHGQTSVYIKKKEHLKNLKLSEREYKSRHAQRRLDASHRKLRATIVGRDPLHRAAIAHYKIGSIIIYSIYVDRAITASFPIKNRRVKNLIAACGRMNEQAVRKTDALYQGALVYLRKEYPFIQKPELYVGHEVEKGTIGDETELSRRQKFYVMRSRRGVTKIVTGRSAKRVLKDEGFAEQKIAAQKELKGLPVFHGIATGTVRIAKRITDLKKLPSNAIVVSPMTVVEFFPYLRDVAGLVTDEGGLGCHAAIVSRELRIPCVVGTKSATKVFKDGDRVEVDATRGIVRKI
ncbi:MAG: PEP-utilizing enzyme [Parcubacteria group bacterium]